MKKLILALVCVTTLVGLNGCGSSNYSSVSSTKSTITFALMSSAGSQASTSTGAQYIWVAAVVPTFNNISTTTSSGPDDRYLSYFIPSNSQRISASSLVKAGPFANNTSVSKRTQITGFVTTDTIHNIKRVHIFLHYSPPATPGAFAVTGSNIEFASLSTTFPAGSAMSEDIVTAINKSWWENRINAGPPLNTNSSFTITNAIFGDPGLINVVPTINKVELGS